MKCITFTSKRNLNQARLNLRLVVCKVCNFFNKRGKYFKTLIAVKMRKTDTHFHYQYERHTE
jgi:hypothetical protein